MSQKTFPPPKKISSFQKNILSRKKAFSKKNEIKKNNLTRKKHDQQEAKAKTVIISGIAVTAGQFLV